MVDPSRPQWAKSELFGKICTAFRNVPLLEHPYAGKTCPTWNVLKCGHQPTQWTKEETYYIILSNRNWEKQWLPEIVNPAGSPVNFVNHGRTWISHVHSKLEFLSGLSSVACPNSFLAYSPRCPGCHCTTNICAECWSSSNWLHPTKSKNVGCCSSPFGSPAAMLPSCWRYRISILQVNQSTKCTECLWNGIVQLGFHIRRKSSHPNAENMFSFSWDVLGSIRPNLAPAMIEQTGQAEPHPPTQRPSDMPIVQHEHVWNHAQDAGKKTILNRSTGLTAS